MKFHFKWRWLQLAQIVCLTLLLPTVGFAADQNAKANSGDTGGKIANSANFALERNALIAELISKYGNAELESQLAELAFRAIESTTEVCEPDGFSEGYEETEDYIYIKSPHSDGMTIKLRIRKRDGKVMVTICGLKIRDITLPCLTYWIRPGSNDIVDDLPWPFETTFCTFERRPDGTVVYSCNFDYFGIHWEGEWRIFIRDGQLCFQKQQTEPNCIPLEVFPPGIRRMWENADPHYLPPAPPREIPAQCPRELAPFDPNDLQMNPGLMGGSVR